MLACCAGFTSSANAADAALRPAEGSYQVAQACGWYAIFQCARNSGVGGPGRTIWTSDFPNFRPGWFCRVMGPFGTQGEAARTARTFGGYAKSAC
jgi:hypothetical protein